MPKFIATVTLTGREAETAAEEIGQALEDLRDSGNVTFTHYCVDVTELLSIEYRLTFARGRATFVTVEAASINDGFAPALQMPRFYDHAGDNELARIELWRVNP